MCVYPVRTEKSMGISGQGFKDNIYNGSDETIISKIFSNKTLKIVDY
jgi:hypothetical protein